jgi:hypothetical protein
MNPQLGSLSHLVAIAAGLTLAACETNRNISGGDSSSQGTMVATTRAESGGKTKPAFETSGDPEGVARIRGQLYYVKDRGTTVLRGRQRISKGLYLESNGDVTLSDGRRVRVLDGYMVTFGGDVIEVPPYLR